MNELKTLAYSFNPNTRRSGVQDAIDPKRF